MGIRDTLNNNPAITTIGAVVVLVLCLGLIVWQATGGGSAAPNAQYFYDLNSGEIFVTEPQPGPVKAPSGPIDNGEPAGVTARIFACGSCKKNYEGMTVEQIAETGAKLTFLKRPYPQQNQNQGEGQQGLPAGYGYRQLITRPGNINWVSARSQRGQQIMNFQLNCPEGKTTKPCYPGSE